MPLHAQGSPEFDLAPLDIYYSQSELLPYIDQSRLFPFPHIALAAHSSDSPGKNPFPLDLPDNLPSKSSTSSIIPVNPQDTASRDNTHFRWGPAIGESLLYTGIMHTFDLAFQAGTRDALNGHWFTHYTQSVSELRGWSDSDTFMAPYVGHPIEGSIFGFIERQNDPRYRRVQLGDGREYWVSMLRSMAFGAFFAQFMFGGRKVTMEIMDNELREQLLKEWNDGNGTLPHYPKRSDYSVENAQNGPSIAIGGGFDVVIIRPFAWRVLNIEYTHSWMNDVAQIHPQEGLKISTQAVVRIGTW
jgi:hypothetical protein